MTGLTLKPGQADLPSKHSTSSYWHHDPSPTLLGHRTSPQLPTHADIVVVGSGITGAFAARELVQSGANVLMLEAREACWGATGRVSDGISSLWPHRPLPGTASGHHVPMRL